MLMVFLLLSFVLKVPNMMESSEIEIVTSALSVRTLTMFFADNVLSFCLLSLY